MPFLLLQIDPHLVEARKTPEARSPSEYGDVIGVFPDDHRFAPKELREFGIVQTDLSLEECRVTFLVPGCPDDVTLVVADAWADYRRAEGDLALARESLDAQAIAAAESDRDERREAWVVAQAKSFTFPARRRHIDIAALPPTMQQATIDFRAKLLVKSDEAKRSARDALIAKLEFIRGTVSAETLEKTSMQIIEDLSKRAEQALDDGAPTPRSLKLDERKQALEMASRAGRALVEDPIVELHDPHQVVFMDRATLLAAVVTK